MLSECRIAYGRMSGATAYTSNQQICQPWPSCSHDMLEAGRSEAEAEDDVDKQLEAYDKAAGFNVDKSPPDFFLAGA